MGKCEQTSRANDTHVKYGNSSPRLRQTVRNGSGALTKRSKRWAESGRVLMGSAAIAVAASPPHACVPSLKRRGVSGVSWSSSMVGPHDHQRISVRIATLPRMGTGTKRGPPEHERMMKIDNEPRVLLMIE